MSGGPHAVLPRPPAGARAERVTINEIARRAGVSKKTVSRVLNHEPFVTPSTRTRVEAVIAELDYRPDPQARGLALGQGHLVALIYDNPNPQYVANMQLGLLDGLEGSGLSLAVHPCERGGANVLADLEAFVTSQRLYGVVLTPSVSEDEAVARMLRRVGCRFVRVASVSLDAPEAMLVTQDRLGGRAVGLHISGLGHRRVGFVSGPAAFRSSAERRAGYEEGLAEGGVRLDAAMVARGAYTFASAVQAAGALLARPDRPTAIFAANDDMAAGVLHAAQRLRLRVPEDLTVAGYDDFDLASQLWPPLTTVRAPTRDVGASAVRRLLGGAAEDPAALAPRLVVRRSSGPPPAMQP